MGVYIDCVDELDFDVCVFQLFVIFWLYCDGVFDGFVVVV